MSRSVACGPDLAHLARVKHRPAAVFELQDEGAAFVEVARDAAHPAPAGLRFDGPAPPRHRAGAPRGLDDPGTFARDLDEGGALILELEDGTRAVLHSGEVREVRPARD